MNNVLAARAINSIVGHEAVEAQPRLTDHLPDEIARRWPIQEALPSDGKGVSSISSVYIDIIA